jgi:hypothetical protein
MDKNSVERLRFDRRLQQRPDWIDKASEEAYFAELPDVSEKMTTCAEEEEAVEAATAAPPVAPPPAAAPTVAPVAGDFSTSRPFGDLGRDTGGN